jgi:hypothetical protein
MLRIRIVELLRTAAIPPRKRYRQAEQAAQPERTIRRCDMLAARTVQGAVLVALMPFV